MTLIVVEGHSPIAIFFKCDISYLWPVARSLCICRASCILHDCRLRVDVGKISIFDQSLAIYLGLLMW